MRAKTINEVLKFEEDMDPYDALKIGSYSNDRLVRLLQDQLSSEILDDFEDFNEYIEDYYKNPEEYEIDTDSQYYDAIEWACQNKREAFKKYINESLDFEQNLDPYTSLGVGISRFVKDAQVYSFKHKKNWFKISDDNLNHDSQINMQYWIVFPAINYRGNIRFARLQNNETVFIEDYKEATNGMIDWHRKDREDPIDPKIGDQLIDWFLTNVEELMSNSIESNQTEYLDMLTI